jgi:hypothetical protein
MLKVNKNSVNFALSLYIPGFFISLGYGIVSPICLFMPDPSGYLLLLRQW